MGKKERQTGLTIAEEEIENRRGHYKRFRLESVDRKEWRPGHN
jgi:hypothetical protein